MYFTTTTSNLLAPFHISFKTHPTNFPFLWKLTCLMNFVSVEHSPLYPNLKPIEPEKTLYHT